MSVFHAGEIAAQHRAGFEMGEAPIRPLLTDQHRRFFATQPILFAALADPAGWPVATVLAGPPGFLSTPDERTLHVATRPALDDPAATGLANGASVGLLGIDLDTRRRNRLNGVIEAVDTAGFSVGVRQSFGNCPQYIQVRHAEPALAAASAIEPLSGLDGEARDMIAAADTFFVASTDGGQGGEAGGLDISHRGGRPGFVLAEDDLLTVPDFRGNRYFNTLGNFLLDGRAGLLFVDWHTGTTLQLLGRVAIEWEGSDRVAGAERLWRVQVTQVWRHRRVLPLRWSFGDYAPQLSRTGVWS